MTDENDQMENMSPETEPPASENMPAQEEMPGEDPEALRRDLEDQMLRLRAEMENLRRRTAREIEERTRYAIGPFARDLLSATDNLRRALTSVDEKARASDAFLQTLYEGVEGIEREVLSAFDKHHISIIAPEPGDKFDPALHEAMFEIETGNHPPGSIVQVLAPGWRLHDRLLRAARVGVARSGPAAHVDTTA